MLVTQPTIQVMALYRAYIYGLKYLALSTFPIVFKDVYNMSIGDASLNYLSLGVGFVIGLQICAPIIDKIYIRLKRHYNSPGRPESRIPLILPGGLLVPIGLFIYGFTARSSVHSIVPNIGAAIFACRFRVPAVCREVVWQFGRGVGEWCVGICGARLGIAAPILFWKFGERMRARSGYCAV
ncbi:hypothetical protein DL95DRAFT_520344 [Leptodontidium sp. 2 PMI_412]|nr:hypothetical protein DL95DRAFT_520344 [Leptodontidium sp. 2 PMI_412]